VKIDLNNLDKSTLDSISSTQRNAAPAPPVASDPVHGDEDAATFSGNNTSAASLVAKALESTPLRADKIEALRQAVQNGTYQVDTREIADAMIRELNDPGSK